MMKMKKCMWMVLVLAAFSAMATAEIQTVASTDFGATAVAVATVADLDAVTTGAASWSASKQFGFSSLSLDTGGTNAGYYVDVKGIAPTPGDNVALTAGSALDFTSLQTIVTFGYTHARTGGSKLLTVEGLDSLGNRVFAIAIDCSLAAKRPDYWDGSAMVGYEGVILDRGSNGTNAYLPDKMTNFTITLEGTTVTYVADGVTVVGTTTSEDFKTLEFQFDAATTWSGFWMDNILFQADDGLGGNNPPTGEISGSNDSTIYYDEGVIWDATSSDTEDDPIDLTYAWTVTNSTSAAGTAPIVFLGGSESQEDPNIAVDMTGITPAEAAGDYTLQLVITDTGGLDVTLSAVLTVLDNLAPVVDAGSDSFVFPLSASKVLEGIVTDDGYPKPAVLTTEWTVEPGAPGTVTFTPDVYDPAASVSFGAEGEYTLTLIASDGEIVGSDSVLITVWPTEYAVVTIQPTDDATIQSSKPDWNLGIRDNMWVNGDGPHQLSFLKFDLAAEAPGAIKLASLSMKTIAANSGFTQTRARPVLYGPSGEWFEGNGNDQALIPDTTGVGITYNSNDLVWDPAVLDEVTGSPIPTNTWFDFDVLGLVREADGKATIGLDAPDMTQGWRGWFPKEKADAKPVLTITYDPNEAYAPIPVDTLIFEVHPHTTLSWEKGATGFATNTVYISKDPDPFTNPEASVVVSSGPEDPNRLVADLSADFPDGLDLSAVYYWGVDNGSCTSDVWSFNTMSYDPRIPALIAPEDASEVVIPFSFEYLPGEIATQHDLHIGADVISDIPAGEYLYDPNAETVQLSLETEYTWSISGTDGVDTWDSETRTFTTANYGVVANFNDPCNPSGFVGGTRDENVFAGDNGIASMRIDYTAGTTTASRTFGVPQDWTATTNRAALYLAYKGWDTNAGGSLEVELYDGTNTESVSLLDDGSVIDDPDPLINDSFRTFGVWDIDLADF
ncbi:MAG: DNRLRE domain-containing protein, partial [Planctomycetes bacterium]|nr:DNRLRE domain-containing protein [Planctomycetota bacterium]